MLDPPPNPDRHERQTTVVPHWNTGSAVATYIIVSAVTSVEVGKYYSRVLLPYLQVSGSGSAFGQYKWMLGVVQAK